MIQRVVPSDTQNHLGVFRYCSWAQRRRMLGDTIRLRSRKQGEAMTTPAAQTSAPLHCPACGNCQYEGHANTCPDPTSDFRIMTTRAAQTSARGEDVKTDETIALGLIEKWQGTGGGILEALKEALAIGRCQEFESRNPAGASHLLLSDCAKANIASIEKSDMEV